MISGMPLPCARCSTGIEAGEDIDRRMPLLSTYLGHVDPARRTGTWRPSRSCSTLISRRLEQLPGGALMTALAPALQAFFTERLITQRNASPQTIAAYRDTFRLLLRFAHEQTGKQPFRAGHRGSRRAADRRVPHPSRTRPRQQPPHPQRQARGDPLVLPLRGAGTSRARAHDRAGHGDPDQTPRAQHRLLPRSRARSRRCSPHPIAGTWLGRRDHALLVLMIQTGVRVSELIGLHVGDIHLGTGAHIRVTGKGRKKRATPLTGETVAVLRAVAHRTPRPARRAAVPHTARSTAQPLHGRRDSSPSTPARQPPTARR